MKIMQSLKNKIKFFVLHPKIFFKKYCNKIQNLFIDVKVNFKKEGILKLVIRSFFFILYGKGVLSKRDLREKKVCVGAYCVESAGGKKNNITASIDSFAKKTEKEVVLLISHNASRTGAPMLTLNILKILSNKLNKRVIILLIQGGPLEDEYKKYGLVINLNQKSDKYVEKYFLVSAIFKKMKNVGVVKCLCNTAISGALVPILEENDFEYINLIHELSGSIKDHGYEKSTENIIRHSLKIVFAAEYSKKDYVKNFKLDNSIAVVRPQGLYKKNTFINNLQEAKDLLHQKLGFGKDVKIVLGCGYASYHKGIDLFFEVAKKTYKNNLQKDIQFIWLGDRDKKIEKELLESAKKDGYLNIIKFCDFEDDPSVFFAGADVFILTSREDTFPSVVLESMDCGVPVVAFENAGGAPEILVNGAGVVVPFLSTKSMTFQLLKLLSDKYYYDQIAKKAKKVVKSDKYSFQAYVEYLMSLFIELENNFSANRKSDFGAKVSVIVPNYNYERYLEKRLNSIINQTLKPFEIIFLDDNSTDKSVEIAEKILSKTNIEYIIVKNEKNHGCFAQWIKGIKMAKGDLIWIAEADDVCKLKFLETLVPYFSVNDTVLAYCQSETIDSNDNVMSSSYHEYTNDLSKTKWKSSYVNSGNLEMNDGLAIKNTIPNASAVLMRKSALQGIEDVLMSYKMTGDWRAYVHVLNFGNIAYADMVLNSHRRHSASIIGSVEKYVTFFKELLLTQGAILNNFIIRDDVYRKMQMSVGAEYARVSAINSWGSSDIAKDGELRDDLSSVALIAKKNVFIQKKGPLTIVVVIPNLIFGGGEIVAIEQANYLAATNKVILYSARPYLRDELFIAKINSNVEIFDSEGTPEDFDKMCNLMKPDIVFSHIWWSDKLVWQAKQLGAKGFKWILTIHGCYEMLMHNPNCDNEFEKIVIKILESADQVIYTADKNKEIFDKKKPKLNKSALKLQNGVMPKKMKKSDVLKRSDFNVAEDAFVFFLCSRAIPEKGWDEAIQAFKMVKSMSEIKRPVHLFFVGASEYEEKLKNKYSAVPGLHFLGNRNDLHLLMPIFDACLLPTYFKSESQPMIIIDSLMQNKPVIATDIGEIPQMLQEGERSAGLLVPLIGGKPDMKVLVKSMVLFIQDDFGIYVKAKEDCKYLSKKYNIKDVMERYFEIIDQLK